MTNRGTYAVESTRVNHNHRRLDYRSDKALCSIAGELMRFQRVGGSIPSRRTLTRHFVESSPPQASLTQHLRIIYLLAHCGRPLALLRVAPGLSVISRGSWPHLGGVLSGCLKTTQTKRLSNRRDGSIRPANSIRGPGARRLHAGHHFASQRGRHAPYEDLYGGQIPPEVAQYSSINAPVKLAQRGRDPIERSEVTDDVGLSGLPGLLRQAATVRLM